MTSCKHQGLEKSIHSTVGLGLKMSKVIKYNYNTMRWVMNTSAKAGGFRNVHAMLQNLGQSAVPFRIWAKQMPNTLELPG